MREPSEVRRNCAECGEPFTCLLTPDEDTGGVNCATILHEGFDVDTCPECGIELWFDDLEIPA